MAKASIPTQNKPPGNKGAAKADATGTTGTTGKKSTAESPPAADPRPPSGNRPSGVWFLLSMVLLAVAIGVVYATAPLWSIRLAEYLPSFGADPLAAARLNGLDDRLGNLEKQALAEKAVNDGIGNLEAARARFSGELKTLMQRVNTIEQSLASAKKLIEATAATTEAADAEEALRRLSQRLSRLEEMGPGVGIEELVTKNQALSSTIDDIAERVGIVERARDSNSAAALAGPAVVVAVGQLRETIRTSAPFAVDLQALEAVAGGDADMAKAIAILKPHAAHGVPALATLRARFGDVAARIVGAAIMGKGDGWFAGAVNRLSALIRVRRTTSHTAGDGADAVVARVEASLEAGDLSAAVDALVTLGGTPGGEAAPWIAQARTRLAVERALASLHVHAISLLAPAKE